MKKSEFNLLKNFAFICTGLTVAILFTAGLSASLQAPTPPGMPFVINIQREGANLKYQAPRNNGGTPVTKYIIEYREKWDLRWRNKGMSDTLLYPIKMRARDCAQFRVKAVNDAGISKPSYCCTFVRFVSPFEE